METEVMELKNTVLGIEFGSTRIKAVLLNEKHIPVAAGSHEWENQLVNGVWTYSLDAVQNGIQACYADLKRDVEEKYGLTLTTAGAIGVSAMMHGYLPFDTSQVAEQDSLIRQAIYCRAFRLLLAKEMRELAWLQQTLSAFTRAMFRLEPLILQ